MVEQRPKDTASYEHFVGYAYKSMMRVVLRTVRSSFFDISEAKQVQVDLCFVADLMNDYLRKDEEMVLAGFIHESINSLRTRVIGGIDESSLAGFEELDSLCKTKRSRLVFIKLQS